MNTFETPIPMPGNDRTHAFFRVPQPMTESDWAYLMNVLAVMHDGLVMPADEQRRLEGLFSFMAHMAPTYPEEP